ncbi:MAG: formylglycine-generating enzyme family protein [Campylobacterota bacterium]|nr:formylglycine-generating enzyme family protein [Campylobacterota bacterium]
MIKKLLLTLLLSLPLLSYEIVIDKSLTKQEMDFIYTLINSKERVYSSANKAQDGFAIIKAGSFMMGSNSGGSDEKPLHKVTIAYDFYMGKYEVTFKEYDKFCDATNRKKPDDRGWGRGDRPVINVSWHDAKAYTKWLSKKEGKTYRLPTEAEWEYAARAGTNTKYSFGDSDSSLDSYAWYYKNSYNKGKSHADYGTHKVGEKKPNQWGLYDMHGNVWEWCEDWYKDSYKNTPKDGTDNNSGSQNYKVLRGGSWYYSSNFLRSAFRNRNFPSNTVNGNGFRVVLLP